MQQPGRNRARLGNGGRRCYLTLRFRALWGGQKVHYINLVTGVNPDNPYEVELRHNVNGDPQNYWRDAS
mgnify:CR=1 FL=1